jgi:hypothetical protein
MTGGVNLHMAIGNANNIIVGAGALYVGSPDTAGTELTEDYLVSATGTEGALSSNTTASSLQNPDNLVDGSKWQSVGYTSEGAELSFEPDFGEVQVDQLLDVAKIFKQGQRVMLNTTLSEATLENLLVVVGGDPGPNGNDGDLASGVGSANLDVFNINGGSLGISPVERSLCLVGPGPEEKATTGKRVERIYVAYRALSMDTVTVGVRRNEATVFPASFRLLASTDYSVAGNASYGKIIDRVFTP